MYVSLIQNAALLVALSTLYGLFARIRRDEGPRCRLLSGVLFGAVAVAGMLLPFQYQPGIIYDGRSIILAMAGLFGGGTGSVVSIVLAGAYRVYLGGSGVWAGLATIVVCPMVGLAFRRAYQSRPEKLGMLPLYLLGLSVHAAMLVCQLLFLPRSTSLHVVGHIWFPIILIFPVATVFIGLLLSNEERRIQTARALRESNDRFNRLVSQLSAVVWTASADGKIKDVNQAFEDIYGASADELKTDADLWLKMTHPDDRHIAEKSADDLRNLGQSQVDYRIIRPDGEIRWLRDRKSMIYEKGKPVAMGGLAADITESKRAEEQVSESERMLAALFANLPGMAYRCVNDPNWTESFVSAGCVELTGYEAADLEESRLVAFNDLVHPDDRQRVWDEINRSLAERGPYKIPYRIETATGEAKWVWDQGSGVYDAEGAPLFLEGFIMDISEKVRAEEALRERDQQLQQSQKMEAIGQLAGGIAHDFNNLLTAILGYSEMILSDGEARGLLLHDYAKEIRRAAERAAALTRQILAFSRRQALQPVLVSPNAVVAGMEPLLRRTLGENIDLVTRLHPDPGLTEVDVHQFEQVLMNLAVNARDAMPLGGRLTLKTDSVELDHEHCRTHPDLRPGSYVLFSVSDTGTGIDEETLPHIFEPFFTTKAVGAGTGLGLSTVYGIVRQSGGSIDVQSELGLGSTFKVYLPRMAEPEPIASAAAIVATPAIGRETVLVVEDEESVRSLAARILGRLGYTVLGAASAAEALELLAATDCSVDLLLTDVILPGGMQGNDLARLVASFRPDLPVLYMSGYPRDAIVHGGRLDDGVNYLEKPFTPVALAAKVREVLTQVEPCG